MKHANPSGYGCDFYNSCRIIGLNLENFYRERGGDNGVTTGIESLRPVKYADIAQLVEHFVANEEVVGSRPIVRSKLLRRLEILQKFDSFNCLNGQLALWGHSLYPT